MVKRKPAKKKPRQNHMSRVIKVDGFSLTVKEMSKQAGFDEKQIINLTKWMSNQKRSDTEVLKYIYR